MALEEKKEIILKTIEIRLDGIGEATNRARITFIIGIIASCAMLITVWNTYYAYTLQRSFDRTFAYKVKAITDESKFIESLNDADKDIFKSLNDAQLSGKKAALLNDVKLRNVLKEKQASQQLNEPELKNLENLNKSITDSLGFFIKLINEKVISSSEFYKEIDGKLLYQTFYRGQPADDATKMQKAGELRTIIANKVLSEDQDFYNGTNHVNKLILDGIFPKMIDWNYTFLSDHSPLPMHEYNKRAASEGSIRNQDVNIGLLGISVNVDQFSLLGSFTLMIISFWMLFSLRRENRSIVSLLRDVKTDTNSPNSETNEDKSIEKLAFHGIVHKLIFANTGKSDKPMSKQIISGGKYNGLNEFLDMGVAGLTKFIRVFSLLLLFLPVITIAVVILNDIYTTNNILSPFSPNPASALIMSHIHPSEEIINETTFGYIFGIITFLICSACLIFQIRTTQALREFESELYSSDSSESNFSKLKNYFSGKEKQSEDKKESSEAK